MSKKPKKKKRMSSVEKIDGLLATLGSGDEKECESDKSASIPADKMASVRATLLASNFVKPLKGTPKVILGTMEHCRRLSEEESKQVTMDFLKRGHSELDTALMYGAGKSERVLGSIISDITDKGGLIATKCYPSLPDQPLTIGSIREQISQSLSNLQCKSVDILYLHWPDQTTPIEETLYAMNELYKQGLFQRLGLSNYSAWQVAEIVYICDKHGYVKPSVYQGMYNAMTRNVESELFPCLRAYGIQFYAYNPLAGGILSGKHQYSELSEDSESGTSYEGRFHGSAKWPKAYRKRFWKKCFFDGIDLVNHALEESYDGSLSSEMKKPSMAEASLRWLMRHSQLGSEDGVIVGVGSMKHYESNLSALENDADLPESVVNAFDEAWDLCRGESACYFR